MESSYIQQLIGDFIKKSPVTYDEGRLNQLYENGNHIIEEIYTISNRFGQKLKCTLIKHKSDSKHHSDLNSNCVVYMHGLGSNRLQGVYLLRYLPKNYCLCLFDTSGSGKSQGNFVTYGMKQQQDIHPILETLHNKKGIKEFILWGRSMGAVACLLYAVRHHSRPVNKPTKKTAFHRQGKQRINSSFINCSEPYRISTIILDSPFQNFVQIANRIATTKLHFPSFLFKIMQKTVQQIFSNLLSDIGQQYNPFLIDFKDQIDIKIPILLLYSLTDEIIPQNQINILCKNIKSKYQKIHMQGCMHNDQRPPEVMIEIISKIQKNLQRNKQQDFKFIQSKSRDLNQLHKSQQKRKGISVLTMSKELRGQYTPVNKKKAKFHEALVIQNIKTQQPYQLRQSSTKSIKRNIVTLQTLKKFRKQELDNIETQRNLGIGYINSTNLSASKLLHQKLQKNLASDKNVKKTTKISGIKRIKDQFS